MTKLHTTASAIVLGAFLTGCASTPNFPIEPAQGAPPADIDPTTAPSGEGPAPQAVPTERIQSGVLPPPAARDPAPTSTPLPPVERPRTPPPPPARALPQRSPGSGKVVTDAPPPVKVEKGDTLIGISRKTGITVEVLARANDLEPPYTVKIGQSVKLPSKRYYVVESGDTLSAIARRFTVEVADLAEFNEFTGTLIRAGQKIYLPEDAKDKGPPPAPKPPPRPAPVAASPEPAPPPPVEPPPPPTPRAPIPYRSTNPPPQSSKPAPPATPRPQQPDTTPLPTDDEITAAGRGRFIWPVRGDVLSRFGPTGGGQRNDGVNIGARSGEGVRAAAKGEVVYAGNQVPGFGNLVLIKHDNGWVTAYAHLSDIDVKMRQTITQGQTIGQAGQTGTVDRPQLHFEIRYAPTPKDKARPVDPLLVLPR